MAVNGSLKGRGFMDCMKQSREPGNEQPSHNALESINQKFFTIHNQLLAYRGTRNVASLDLV
jgi:hypothetical protein